MQKKTVLVVDDNELNLKLMQGILKVINCQMAQALDARTGIEMAEQLNPDLIVMDVQLPDMDGIEAVRRIKKKPELSMIPVIAVTGYGVEDKHNDAKNAGCAAIISKPIAVQAFIDKLNQLMPSSAF
jgi:two-component system cell cycle response regulator DivK